MTRITLFLIALTSMVAVAAVACGSEEKVEDTTAEPAVVSTTETDESTQPTAESTQPTAEPQHSRVNTVSSRVNAASSRVNTVQQPSQRSPRPSQHSLRQPLRRRGNRRNHPPALRRRLPKRPVRPSQEACYGGYGPTRRRWTRTWSPTPRRQPWWSRSSAASWL